MCRLQFKFSKNSLIMFDIAVIIIIIRTLSFEVLPSFLWVTI